MDKRMWEQEYPKMPEAFHQAVEWAVEAEVQGAPEADGFAGRKRRSVWRVLVPAAILAAALAAGAVLAKEPSKKIQVDLKQELQLEGLGNLDSILEKNVTVRVEEEPVYPETYDSEFLESMEPLNTDQPLLDIQEVLYDGQRLAIAAVPSGEGEAYTFECWNMRFGDETIGPIEMAADWENHKYYIFQAYVGNLELTAPFDVTLPVRVYGKNTRMENQDLTVTVTGNPVVESIKDQEFVFEDYTVKTTELKKSATALWGKITVEMTEAQKEAYENSGTEIFNIQFRSGEEIWKTLSFPEEFPSFDWDLDLPETDTSTGSETDEPVLEKYFYVQPAEADPSGVTFHFLGYSEEDIGEKYDMTDPANQYGEEMALSLEGAAAAVCY